MYGDVTDQKSNFKFGEADIDTCWPMTILAQMRGEELVIHEECSGLLLDHTAKG